MARTDHVGWRAAGRFLKIAPVPELPEPKPLDLPGRGRTVYVDTGLPDVPAAAQRPTLILLHALATTGLLCWYPCLAELSKRHRVVVFDQRWHGRGIRSADFRLEDCAGDVAAVADALGIDHFVPVGYSMGSLVAQLTWRQHPDRVTGAVLAASTENFRFGRGELPGLSLATNRLYRSSARRIAPLAADLTDDLAGPVAGDGRDWAFREFSSTPYAQVAGATATISRFDSSPWIGRMAVPTAVVIPTKDRAIPAGRQRRLAKALPHSTTYEFLGGHASIVLNAEAFRPALLAACASVSVRLAAAENGRPG